VKRNEPSHFVLRNTFQTVHCMLGNFPAKNETCTKSYCTYFEIPQFRRKQGEKALSQQVKSGGVRFPRAFHICKALDLKKRACGKTNESGYL